MTSTTSESILLCSPPTTTTTTTTTSTIKMTTRNHQGTNTASHFTVFIRLPFPRGDFVDPQPAEWNASKDRALWDVLSRPSKGDDVDWKALADSFDVTLEFLLQQAAWLYDRQLSKVRAQMRRVGTTTNTKAHPNASSPASGPGSVSGSTALEGQSTMKTAPGSRVPSRLTMRQADTHSQRAPQRTDSTTSVNAIKAPRDSSRNATPTVEKKEPKWESFNHHRSSSRRKQTVPTAPAHLRSPLLEEEDDDLSPSSSESESEDEEDEEKEPDVSGPRYRHFGKFSTYRPDLMPDDEEDEEDSPAFLPMSHEERLAPAPAPAPASREDPGQDLNATLRLNAEPRTMSRRHTAERVPATRKSLTTTESSTSSTSTGAVAISGSQTEHARRASQAPTVLSPKRTAELARRSSRRSNTSGRDTSDGTPSMGSSFSDLDDASVSQSALEEALMSNMQQGGMASRMSTISQALRSRYIG